MARIDDVVTGATGLVGRWLVPALTAKGRRVGALVREAAARGDAYRRWVDAHGGDSTRVELFEADLGRPGLGLAEGDRQQLGTASCFFHLGAAMRFGLELDEARRVNVEGTRALLELASSARALRRVVHVGGFRLGADAGAALERLGGYERSKIEADAVVRTFEERGVPVTRVQPGAVIGDSRTGESTQFWGFSDLVRDLFHGRLPGVIGGDGYWMPLVAVDHLADFIAGVPELVHSESEYIVIDDATPDLAELLERITRHLGVSAVRRTIPKGPIEWFLRHGGERLTGVSAEAVSFIARDRYDLDATKRAEAELGLRAPDIGQALLRSVDFLVRTRFGKDARAASTPRIPAGMTRVAGIPTFVEGMAREVDALLLHGIPLDASSWDAVVDALPSARTFTTARADLPGLGRTTKETADPARWMESLLAGHRGRPWIVAHSLGTRYAVEHAALHPRRVAGLVLVSPFFLQAPPPVLLRSGLTGALAFALMRDSDLVRLVGAASADAPREWLSRPGARGRIARALADAHAAREELGRKLRGLAVPVVIVAGERDPLLSADVGRAQVITVPGAGHFPQLEAPAAVAAAIAAAIRPRARSVASIAA